VNAISEVLALSLTVRLVPRIKVGAEDPIGVSVDCECGGNKAGHPSSGIDRWENHGSGHDVFLNVCERISRKNGVRRVIGCIVQKTRFGRQFLGLVDAMGCRGCRKHLLKHHDVGVEALYEIRLLPEGIGSCRAGPPKIFISRTDIAIVRTLSGEPRTMCDW